MVTSSKSRSEKTARKQITNKPVVSATATTANGNGASPSSGEDLRRLYASLLKSRLLQKHVRELQEVTDRYEISLGQEAVTSGATADLRPGDTIAVTRRNLAALIATGAPLTHLLASGQEHQSCTCALASAPVSSYLADDPFNAGTGIALAHKLSKRQNVVVAFCSDESPSPEGWREALHIASVQKLPILYVARSFHPTETTSAKTGWLEDFSYYMKDHGFPNINVDGRDVVAVWRVAQESIHRARNGSGPTLIDCRMESPQDPLSHMEHYMRKRSLWDDTWKKQLVSEIEQDIAAATKGV